MSIARRGATAVEFAFVLPVLFTMAAGITTYAWYFMVRASLVDAVTEGARRGASYIAPPDLGFGDDDADGMGGPHDGFGDDDDDGASAFGTAILSTATQETLDAAQRGGWDKDAVSVNAVFSTVNGVNMLTVTATADLDSRFEGMFFPLPDTVVSTLTVATLDQP